MAKLWLLGNEMGGMGSCYKPHCRPVRVAVKPLTAQAPPPPLCLLCPPWQEEVWGSLFTGSASPRVCGQQRAAAAAPLALYSTRSFSPLQELKTPSELLIECQAGEVKHTKCCWEVEKGKVKMGLYLRKAAHKWGHG